MITFCSIIGLGAVRTFGDEDETVDDRDCSGRIARGSMVAMAGSRAASPRTRGLGRSDQLRSVSRVSLARFAATSGAPRSPAGRAWSFRSREVEPRAAQGLLQQARGDAGRGTRPALPGALRSEIDVNHDGKLDPEERAVWRGKQR